MQTSIMVCQTLREEFRLKHLRHNHPNDRVFYCCMWRWPRPVFVILRFALALYTTFGLIHLIVKGDDDSFEYFTAWSYMVLMLHMVIAAVLSVVFYGNAKVDKMQSQNQSGASKNLGADNPGYDFTSRNDQTQQNDQEGEDAASNDSGLAHSTKWYFKVSWCLSYIISSAAPVVTIIFFVGIYRYMEASKLAGLDLRDTNIHALNLVFVVIDHMISARPVRLMHLVSSLLYGLIYIIFSIIYWSVDHENHVIYPGFLDWNNPGVTVGASIGLGVVAFPLLQLAYFGVYHLKNAIHKKLYGVPFDGSSTED